MPAPHHFLRYPFTLPQSVIISTFKKFYLFERQNDKERNVANVILHVLVHSPKYTQQLELSYVEARSLQLSSGLLYGWWQAQEKSLSAFPGVLSGKQHWKQLLGFPYLGLQYGMPCCKQQFNPMNHTVIPSIITFLEYLIEYWSLFDTNANHNHLCG